MKLAVISSKEEKKNQKGIACYIKGYSIVIIKKISKRSAGQHCSAYAKHSARLKVMKCMIFFFLHFQSILV